MKHFSAIVIVFNNFASVDDVNLVAALSAPVDNFPRGWKNNQRKPMVKLVE